MSQNVAMSRIALALLLTIPPSVSAQISGQSFEVIPEATHATVGDTVTLQFRVRLDERDLLFDTVPQPLTALPPGVRLLSVEKLSRTPDRIFHGKAHLAFYRPGRRTIPIFGLPFMRAVKGVGRGTLPSDSAFIEITPLLPAGNPSLKDIRELEPLPHLTLFPFAVATVLTGLLVMVYLRRRRHRPAPLPIQPEPAAPPPAPSPYAVALEALDRLEGANWPARGQVERHYEAAVDVIRDYLEAAEELVARERTTEELVWSLPPHLSERGLRDRLRDLLDEADLVKFARVRPSTGAATLFLQQCRALLTEWYSVLPLSESADALR
jgi:hypothetical protein